jgi:hypothetical protein
MIEIGEFGCLLSIQVYIDLLSSIVGDRIVEGRWAPGERLIHEESGLFDGVGLNFLRSGDRKFVHRGTLLNRSARLCYVCIFNPCSEVARMK